MSFTQTAQALMRTPTASYCEQWLMKTLDALLADIPGLEIKRDQWGNTFARLRRGGSNPGTIAYVAHLDHPGFVVHSVDGTRVIATFQGNVDDEYFKTEKVRLFRSPEDAGVRASVVEVSPWAKESHSRDVIMEAESDATGAAIGMWDVVPCEVTADGLLRSRAIDDLGGCATIIETLRAASLRPEPVDLIGVFTRAEECGYRGALLLCQDPEAESFIPRDSWVISVETSSARPNTPIGEGAVLRVGDKSTIFDPVITRTLDEMSETLRERGHRPLRRALMDGGTCEATAFNAYGWPSGGVCLPLGNYHNMNPHTKRIDCEFISLADAEALIVAMTEVALMDHVHGPTAIDRLRDELDGLAKDAYPKFANWGVS